MDKTAVLTGQFSSDVEAVKKILARNKINVVDRLQKNSILLIVGEGTKFYWVNSPTGALIHEATRRDLDGDTIEVLYEKAFLRKFDLKPNLGENRA